MISNVIILLAVCSQTFTQIVADLKIIVYSNSCENSR